MTDKWTVFCIEKFLCQFIVKVCLWDFYLLNSTCGIKILVYPVFQEKQNNSIRTIFSHSAIGQTANSPSSRIDTTPNSIAILFAIPHRRDPPRIVIYQRIFRQIQIKRWRRPIFSLWENFRNWRQNTPFDKLLSTVVRANAFVNLLNRSDIHSPRPWLNFLHCLYYKLKLKIPWIIRAYFENWEIVTPDSRSRIKIRQ